MNCWMPDCNLEATAVHFVQVNGVDWKKAACDNHQPSETEVDDAIEAIGYSRPAVHVSKYNGNDVVLSIEPLVEPDTDGAGEFAVNVNVAKEDGGTEELIIEGLYRVHDDNRMMYINKLAAAGTMAGHVQRQIAKVNDMRLVDRKTIDRAMEHDQ